jgi:hypothetical protein
MVDDEDIAAEKEKGGSTGKHERAAIHGRTPTPSN